MAEVQTENLPTRVSRTFFYVFTSPTEVSQDTPQSDEPPKLSDDPESTRDLDSIVLAAFKQFQDNFALEAKVFTDFIGPDFHRLRTAFGIIDLPAFGVSDFDLSDKELSDEPPRLPSRIMFWKWPERKSVLESGRYLPKVERQLIEELSGYNEPQDASTQLIGKLFNTIRTLHIKNIDGGLSAVADKIEQSLLASGGRKVLKAAQVGKKIFVGN